MNINKFLLILFAVYYCQSLFGADFVISEYSPEDRNNITWALNGFPEECRIAAKISQDGNFDKNCIMKSVAQAHGQRWWVWKHNTYHYTFAYENLLGNEYKVARIHGICLAAHLQQSKDHQSCFNDAMRAPQYQFWKKCAIGIATVTGAAAVGAYRYGHQTVAAGLGACAALCGASAGLFACKERRAVNLWIQFCSNANNEAKGNACKIILDKQLLTQDQLNEAKLALWPKVTKKEE